MSPLPKQLVPFILIIIKPYKGWVSGLFAVAFFWALFGSFQPYMLKLLIDQVAHYNGTPELLLPSVLSVALGYIGLSFAIGILFRFYDYIILTLMPSLKRDISHTMFRYLEGHSTLYFQNNFAGSLANKITDMTRGIPELLTMATEQGVAVLFNIVIAVIMLYPVAPILAEITAVWAFLFFFISYLFSKKGRIYAQTVSESSSILSGKTVDSITNIMNVRLFARRQFEDEYLLHYTQDVMSKDRAMQWYVCKMRIFQFCSVGLMFALMLFFLIKERSMMRVTTGDFALVIGLIARLIDYLWHAANELVRFATEVGKCQQALSIITAPHDIVDAPDAKPLHITEGRIVFDNVTFHYQTNNILFKNKHVAIKAGSKVGLVGFSGSGKTTFANLILRFFEVEGGSILIDGQNIAHVTQDSLHGQISMIPQDTSLFHRSLMENIRYGRLSATDEEVIAASKQAHCDEFIRQLPEGYTALVGERGIKLSGGQRQRIAIARAILKNAPILILDEATSALDSVTEKHIQEGLHTLMQNRTVIVIAHRLSTLSEMDRILVFDKGHIIEDGTHDALLALGGHYATMWQCQAGGFLPEVEN